MKTLGLFLIAYFGFISASFSSAQSLPVSQPTSKPAASQPSQKLAKKKESKSKLSRVKTKKRDQKKSTTDDYQLTDSLVLGQKRAEATASAVYKIDLDKLKIIPRRSAAEQLMLAPGVLTSNHGGEGHAHETYMRGFASKEGQEIEYTVDGVPLNDINNPHGHGYADIYFMPPEFVKRVSISEGPFDPEQGDFAFAGSANYELGLSDKGITVSYGFGRFNTQRLITTYAPQNADDGTFAGFELYQSDGFGPNRAAQRALGLGRYTNQDKRKGLSWALSAYGYAARFDQPGVVRQDDYLAGKMGFFDTYDSNQGGESGRLLLTFDTKIEGNHADFKQVSWLGYRTMRLRVNFTGWMTDALVNDDGTVNVQRGDGLELRYKALDAGSRGHYELSKSYAGLKQKLALGYAIRYSQGRSTQLRLRSVTAIPYKREFDDDFSVVNLAGFLRTQIMPLSWLTLRGGVRVDAFSFGLLDLNHPDADREGERESDQSAQSFGYIINPRVTADAKVWRDLHLLLSYGQGTRSVDASSLSDNETAPFALAHVFDSGIAYSHGKMGRGAYFKSQLSYVYTHVDKDILFDPVSGRNILFSEAGSGVLVGPTTRHAILSGNRFNYDQWLDVLLNVGYAKGTLDATGELLPYIPQLVMRLDAAVNGKLFNWRIKKQAVKGRLGVGFTYVPGRPLPYGAFGDPYYLMNIGGEIRLWHFSLGLEVRNLFDLRYRQAEFNYASNFRGPDAVISKRNVRHFTAGEPFFIMSTLKVHLDGIFGSEPIKRRLTNHSTNEEFYNQEKPNFPPLSEIEN